MKRNKYSAEFNPLLHNLDLTLCFVVMLLALIVAPRAGATAIANIRSSFRR